MGTFPQEPVSPAIWSEEKFDELLRWAVAQGASDISVIPEFPMTMRLHGRWQPVSSSPVASSNIQTLLAGLSRDHGNVGKIQSGIDHDFSYEVSSFDRRTDNFRFRCNATACQVCGDEGINIVLRSIPGSPPTVESLGVEPELVEHLSFKNGLGLVAGTMGSGKSTLLAAQINKILITEPWKSIGTYEKPIEFDLTRTGGQGLIVQSEIGRDIRNWEEAPVNATRRAFDVILVGESRDCETFRGVAEVAEIGTAAYTTVHTQSVAETVRRIVNKFPLNERPYILTTVLGNLRVLVYQTLVERKDGNGRVAVREWLPISKEFRRKLLNSEFTKLPELFHAELHHSGMPLIRYAKVLLEQDLISEGTFTQIEKSHSFEILDKRSGEEVGHVA